MMSDQFHVEMRAQNDYLRQQLHALHQGPRKRWKDYRLLEVVCKRRKCGNTVLEVMNTKPYRVVRTWEAEVTKGERRPVLNAGLSYAEIRRITYENIKNTTTLSRRGESMFFPIPTQWEGDLNEIITSACSCRKHELTGRQVADWLRAALRFDEHQKVMI